MTDLFRMLMANEHRSNLASWLERVAYQRSAQSSQQTTFENLLCFCVGALPGKFSANWSRTTGAFYATMSNRSLRCVFVGNIPYETTEEQLVEVFQQVGPVVSFRLFKNNLLWTCKTHSIRTDWYMTEILASSKATDFVNTEIPRQP